MRKYGKFLLQFGGFKMKLTVWPLKGSRTLLKKHSTVGHLWNVCHFSLWLWNIEDHIVRYYTDFCGRHIRRTYNNQWKSFLALNWQDFLSLLFSILKELGNFKFGFNWNNKGIHFCKHRRRRSMSQRCSEHVLATFWCNIISSDTRCCYHWMSGIKKWK